MNSPLPSRHEAWTLMRDAAPPDWVLRHVSCVERLAVAMADAAHANGHQVDKHLVQVGAVLHDIGRAETHDPTHAHLGAERLRKAGMPTALVHVVERHTGAGITPTEAPDLGVPTKDYTPGTIEEKIVAHADNLYSGDKRLTMEQLRAKYDAKGLLDAFARIRDLHDELCAVCGIDLETLEPTDLPPL